MKSKELFIYVTKSSFETDTDFPWKYSSENFCYWVWEVLLAGYKDPFSTIPTLAIAIDIAQNMGYELEVRNE